MRKGLCALAAAALLGLGGVASANMATNGDFSSTGMTTDGWGFNWRHSDHMNGWNTYNSQPWVIQGDQLIRNAAGSGSSWVMQVMTNSCTDGNMAETTADGTMPVAGDTLDVAFDYTSVANLRVRVYATNRTSWNGLDSTDGLLLLDQTVSGTAQHFSMTTAALDAGYAAIALYFNDGAVSDTAIDNVSVNVSVVPEPASLGLLGLGSLLALRRRRA